MTFRQNLEIGAGVATSLAVLIAYALFVGFILNSERRPSDANSFAIVLLSVWLCSLMVAIGAYYNTTKQSNIALVVLVIGAIIITVILGFWGFVVSIFGGIFFGLFLFAPVGLAVLTTTLAITSRVKNVSEMTKSHFDSTFR